VALNHRFVPYSPDEVFHVLEQPELYGNWVVGARKSAEKDPRWPQPGAELWHQQGIGPIHLTDVTSVVAVDRPTCIVLNAKVRPFFIAEVTITLEQTEGGTMIWMREEITSGPLRPLSRIFDPVIRLRNAKTLQRLEQLAAAG